MCEVEPNKEVSHELILEPTMFLACIRWEKDVDRCCKQNRQVLFLMRAPLTDCLSHCNSMIGSSHGLIFLSPQVILERTFQIFSGKYWWKNMRAYTHALCTPFAKPHAHYPQANWSPCRSNHVPSHTSLANFFTKLPTSQGNISILGRRPILSWSLLRAFYTQLPTTFHTAESLFNSMFHLMVNKKGPIRSLENS